MDFKVEIKRGAEDRFQYAKQHLQEVAGCYYEEVRHIANELYAAGYEGQAKKFVELAYLHLRNHDKIRYTTVRRGYVNLLGGVYDN